MSSVTISNLPAASSAGVNDLVPSTQADGTTRKITLGQITNLVPSSIAFLDLTDTPGSYGGQQNKLVAVNNTSSGLEFVTGGAIVTARNGLTEFSGGDVRMGGVLTQLTEIGQPGDPWDWILEADDITVAADSKVAMTAATGDATIQTQVGNIRLDAVNASAAVDIDSAGAVTIDAGGLARLTSTTQNVQIESTALTVDVDGVDIDIDGSNTVAIDAGAGNLTFGSGGGSVLGDASVNMTLTAGNVARLEGSTDAELVATGGVAVLDGAGGSGVRILTGTVPTAGDILVALNAGSDADWQTVAGLLQSASNGLNAVGTDVRMGGALTQNTVVGLAASGFDWTLNADNILLDPDTDLSLNAGVDVNINASNETNIRGNLGLSFDTGIGANSGMPTEPGDVIKAIGTAGEAIWQQDLKFAQWFLPFSAIADAEFPLVGEISLVGSALVADFATVTAMRRTHTSIVVNTITTGGDIVITGDSVNGDTSVVTTGDTETITVDTTAAQGYQTDKVWLQISSVNVSAGTIVNINYDLRRLSYIFSSGTQAANQTAVRILGYRCEFTSTNNNCDLGVQVFIINDDGGKKQSIDTIEDIIWTSTNGNGVITDNLRGGGSDRSYTGTVTAIPSGSVYQFRQTDFNTFFTSDENLVQSGANNGLQVIFTGTAGGLTAIDHGTFTLLFLEEPE